MDNHKKNNVSTGTKRAITLNDLRADIILVGKLARAAHENALNLNLTKNESEGEISQAIWQVIQRISEDAARDIEALSKFAAKKIILTRSDSRPTKTVLKKARKLLEQTVIRYLEPRENEYKIKGTDYDDLVEMVTKDFLDRIFVSDGQIKRLSESDQKEIAAIRSSAIKFREHRNLLKTKPVQTDRAALRPHVAVIIKKKLKWASYAPPPPNP